MHKLYEDSIKDLDKLDLDECKKCAKVLVRMLAALSHSIYECCPEKKADEVTLMFQRIIEGTGNGISKDK